jgi:hypothetical protein
MQGAGTDTALFPPETREAEGNPGRRRVFQAIWNIGVRLETQDPLTAKLNPQNQINEVIL